MTERQTLPRVTVSPCLGFFVVALGFFAAFATTRPLLLALAFLGVLTVVHVGAMTLTALLSRTPIMEVALFMGPRLLRFRIGETYLTLCGFPLGGFVRIAGMEPTDDAPVGFAALPLPWRLLILSSGVIALFLVSVVCLEYGTAFQVFGKGFAQIIMGAFAPVSYGAVLVEKTITLYQIQGFAATLGVLAAKFAAFNALPLPLLNGGAVIMELFRSRLSSVTTQRLYNIGFVVLLFNLGWGTAILSYWLKHR